MFRLDFLVQVLGTKSVLHPDSVMVAIDVKYEHATISFDYTTYIHNSGLRYRCIDLGQKLDTQQKS